MVLSLFAASNLFTMSGGWRRDHAAATWQRSTGRR